MEFIISFRVCILSLILLWTLLINTNLITLSNAFVINSFNGSSSTLGTIADTVRVISISESTGGVSSLSVIAMACNSTDTGRSFVSNSTHCLVWLSDVLHSSELFSFPTTALLDKSHGEPAKNSSRLSYVPLLGSTNQAICTSTLWYDSAFPCAILVIDTTSPQSAWLVTTWTSIMIPLPKESAFGFPSEKTVQLPFNCSVELPCSVRTPDAQEGTVGGCNVAASADTLVVVTWNRMRYLFRPLQYFNGKGQFTTIESLEEKWEPFSQYDASLQFHTVVQTTMVSGGSAFKLQVKCVMHVLRVDGTSQVYDSDVDDVNSQTGLLLLANLSVPANSDTIQSPICFPYLQHIVVSTYDSLFRENVSVVSEKTIISINCNDGTGWFWELSLLDGMNPFSVYLAGSYKITPPPSTPMNCPLIADIAIVAISSDCDQSSLDPQTGHNRFTYVTKIALLSAGVFSQSRAGQYVNSSFASFATFTSNSFSRNGTLTQQLVSSAISSIELKLLTLDMTAPVVQHMMHGTGWAVAASQPLQTEIPLNGLLKNQCFGNTKQLVEWYAVSGILYGAVTELFSVIINATDGNISPWCVSLVITNAKDVTVNGSTVAQYNVSGGTYSWPVRLPDSVVEGGSTSTFFRLPSSPLFTIRSRAGDQATALVQEIGSKSILHLLAQPVKHIKSLDVGSNTSVWCLSPNNENFTPSAITVSTVVLSLGSSSSSDVPSGSTVKSVWASSGTLAVREQDYTNSLSLVSLIVGTAAFLSSQSVTVDLNNSHQTTGNSNVPMVPTLTLSSQIIFVCKGNRVYGSYNTPGNIVVTVSDLCYPASARCFCSPDHPVFLSAPTEGKRSYVFITMYYPETNATGTVIGTLDGEIVAYNSQLVTHGLPIGCSVSNSEPKIFGGVTEVSAALGTTTVLTPITGTRCMMMMTLLASENEFLFVYFVHTGDSPAYASTIGFAGSYAILSTNPVLYYNLSRYYISTLSGTVYSFAVSSLWKSIELHTGAVGSQTEVKEEVEQKNLKQQQLLQLGAAPTAIWANVSAFTFTDGLLVYADIYNVTLTNSPNDEVEDNDTDIAVRFETHDILTGNLIFVSDYTYVSQASVTPHTLPLITMFTSMQVTLGQNQDLQTRVCLAIGTLLCVDDVTSSQNSLSEYSNNGSWGLPAQGQTKFQLTSSRSVLLVWAQEGFVPIAIAPGDKDNFVTWEGLSWGSDKLRGGDSQKQIKVNQTSCRSGFISNQGLFIKCSLLSENYNEPQLFIVDATSGEIVLGNGPRISQRINTMVLADDYQTLLYVDDLTLTISALQLESFEDSTENMPVTNVCANDGFSMYAFVVYGGQVGGIVATKTPLDVNASAYSIRSDKEYQISSQWTFPTSVLASNNYSAAFTLGQLATTSSQLTSDLGGALYPGLRDLDQINFQTNMPTSLVDDSGAITLMSMQLCEDCTLNCPQLCALNIDTGDQFMLTSKMSEIVYIVKPFGQYNFDESNIMKYWIGYSGNATLNLLRYLYTNRMQLQEIECQYYAVTTFTAPSRYCLQSGTSAWSVIEFAADSSVYVVTYQPTKTTSGRAGFQQKYNARDGSSISQPIFSVLADVGLAEFLNINIQALPPVVEASNMGVTIVYKVIQVVNTSSPTIPTGMLTLMTNAGNLTYGQDTCDKTNAIPMCGNSLPITDTEKLDIDSSFQTVTWEGVSGSNWGSGFVASGFELSIDKLLRSPVRGTAVNCVTYERNDQCTIVCQPTTNCSSLLRYMVLNYLSIKSFLPSGSTFTALSGNYPGCPTVRQLLMNGGEVNVPLRLYPTSEDSAILTVVVDGIEIVVASDVSSLESVLGVQFSCSRCQFYLLTNIVAQPFGWLAICAIKTLVITLVFYFLESFVRTIESQRSTLLEQIAIQEAEIAELKSSLIRLLPSVPLRESRDCELVVHDGDTKAENAQRLLRMEEDLMRDKASELAMRRGFCLPNLVDKAVRILASLSAIRHPLEKGLFHRQVRRNLLHKDQDSNTLTALLFGILGEEPDNLELVSRFADYYQWEMCRGMCWVVRAEPSVGTHPGLKLDEVLRSQLDFVHGCLKDIFIVYKNSLWLNSLPIEDLRKIESTSSADQGGDNRLKARPKSTINVSSADKTLLRGSMPPHEATSLIDTRSIVDSAAEDEEMTIPQTTDIFLKSVAAFNALHNTHPACFEYAVLPRRKTDARLQPSAILLGLSLVQSYITLLVYAADVNYRSQSNPLTHLQIYQCTYFMVFNSSLPATLLVNAVCHRNLEHSDVVAAPLSSRLLHLLSSPFVVATLVLLGPALLTHVIPGLFLYVWITVPLLALTIGIEYVLRLKCSSLPSRVMIAVRMLVRVAMLFSVAVALSVAFNAADAYMWQAANDQPSAMFATGTYMRQPYFSALAQDYNARSMQCVWEHLLHTVSNFLQMGFFLV